jgi:hypothetical protein
MQIEVRDESRMLWVEEFGCFLENGELAFSYYGLPDIIEPDWCGAPEGSLLREGRKSNNPEHPNEELRSMRITAGDVFTYYKERLVQNEFRLIENPVVDHALQMMELSRIQPGFYAETDAYRLSLEAYEHRGICFWRVKHGPKLLSGFRSKKEPKYLVLVNQMEEKEVLQNPETGDQLWATAGSLTEEPPRHAQYPKFVAPEKSPISWSILPGWIEMEIVPGTEITASSAFHGGAHAGFSAMKLTRDPHIELEICLDRLDAFAFDPTGIDRPQQTYYLSPMTGGRHISVHVSAESGDTALLTFVSTMAEPVLYGYYSTARTLEDFLAGRMV